MIMTDLVFVDVEATTATPMTGLMTEFGAIDYRSRRSFHGVLYDSEPDPDMPVRPRLTQPVHRYDHARVMTEFAAWLGQTHGRPVLVSDNPGYDAMWIACAFDQLGMDNPFGHSSRRISDFYAGLVRDFSRTRGWKRWRVTAHDHNPVHDAMGNVEAFDRILVEFGAVL